MVGDHRALEVRLDSFGGSAKRPLSAPARAAWRMKTLILAADCVLFSDESGLGLTGQ
jgi:hypothetical protein